MPYLCPHHVLWNSKTYYQVHMAPLLALSSARWSQSTSSILFFWDQFKYPAVYTNALPSDLLVSNIPTTILHALSSPPVCHIPCQSHSSWFDDFNGILWGVEVVELLISNFLNPPHYYFTFSPTNLSQCPVSTTLSLWYSPNVR